MHANKGPVECNALQGRLAEWQSTACGGTIRSIGIALWITIKLFSAARSENGRPTLFTRSTVNLKRTLSD